VCSDGDLLHHAVRDVHLVGLHRHRGRLAADVLVVLPVLPGKSRWKGREEEGPVESAQRAKADRAPREALFEQRSSGTDGLQRVSSARPNEASDGQERNHALHQHERWTQTKQNAGFSTQKPKQDIGVSQVVEILLNQSENLDLNPLLEDPGYKLALLKDSTV